MSLSGAERDLIRTSFRAMSRSGPTAAGRFYEKLFQEAPETRKLFVNDLEQQGSLLMGKLGLIVAQLDNLEGQVPALEDLALRHVAYGVKPEHYPPFGSALLGMLGEILGDDFTPEARAAWSKAYRSLSALMIRSAYSHGLPRERKF